MKLNLKKLYSKHFQSNFCINLSIQVFESWACQNLWFFFLSLTRSQVRNRAHCHIFHKMALNLTHRQFHEIFFLKFIYSEKAKKNLKNLQTFFVSQIKLGDYFQFFQPSQNIWTFINLLINRSKSVGLKNWKVLLKRMITKKIKWNFKKTFESTIFV